MRKVLKDRQEVAHYWANKVQPEGRAGNVFFEGDKIYSYGKHFCIARHLPNGSVALTTQRYSPSTGQHISIVRHAINQTIVYCHAPDEPARDNLEHARKCIARALADAELPRIRPHTREAHKARALRIAETANAYLAALPENEKVGMQAIDITSLESVRDALIAADTARAEQAKAAEQQRIAQLADAAQEWRNGTLGHRYGLHQIPPMLRLAEDSRIVETSHGAEIPVADAIALWPVIQRVMRGDKNYKPGAPIGVYSLTQIRTDGSIRVGCHDIAYVEIERIAKALGLLDEVAA